MKKVLLNSWPFVVIIFVVLVFFWKVIFQGQVPIPGDFIVGTYFPWLDYKWGYSVGVPVKNPITSDVVSIIYPLRSFAIDQLKSGHLPLWNPYMFTGTPLLADFQVAVFSPTIFLYFMLPKVWAWTGQVMLQPIFAGIFMYLLLRNFGLKKVESVFSGIFYAFAGFNMIWMEWNTSTLVAAFIPLTILLMDKFIKTNELHWGALLSIGIGLQMLAGYPQLVVYTIAALIIFVFFRWKYLTPSKLLLVLLFIFAGFLVSSIVTIPGIEFILNSQRKYEVLEKELIYLPWRNLVTFLAPDYLGNPATKNYFGIGNYTLNAGYSGIIVLTLSIVGVLGNWMKKEIKYFVLLFVMALLLALPTPVASAIFNSHIPAISASSMTRILVLANLSISALAGFGIASLFGKERIKNIGFIFVPLGLTVCILAITLFKRINLEITLRNLVLPISLSTAAVLLILPRKKFLVFILCIVAVLELFRYGWKYTPFSSPGLVFPETPVLNYFKDEKEPFRVSGGDVIPMNMLVPYGIETVSGYDAVFPIWWARLNSTISSGNPTPANLSYYSVFEQYGNHWFDLLNNKYLFVNVQEHLISQIEKNSKFKKVFQDKSVAIFRNNNVLPRAFFVSNWVMKSGNDALTALAAPNFPVVKEIVIENPVNFNKSDIVNSSVSYEFYSPEKSIIDVKTDHDGFLFVSDAWYPGWLAKVDGLEEPVYRANYAFRAVAVSEGVHRVEFIYSPDSLRTGELVSMVTLMFLAGIFIYDLKIYEKVFSK